MQKIRCRLVGTSFSDRPTQLKWLRENPKAPCYMSREPDNEHDPNAVRIMMVRPDGVACLGYVPRDIAAQIAPIIDKRLSIRLDGISVTGGRPGRPSLGGVIDITIRPDIF